MSITGFIKGHWHRVARSWLERRLAGQPPKYPLDRSQWEKSLRDPTAFYFECMRYFHQQLPAELKAHRAYFYNVPGNRRGFGEDAFHVMWHLLFQEFRPANFLEIGVFRGQTISLAALCARMREKPCEVQGISPFSAAGDRVSNYRGDIDYYEDTLANFDHFRLPHPKLLKAYSSDPAALELIAARSWDMIYIDGNHDYEVVAKDWEACSKSLKRGGIIVLDDAGLTTVYHPPAFAGTRGHPGPSRLAQEINRGQFGEILQVGHNRVFQRIA